LQEVSHAFAGRNDKAQTSKEAHAADHRPAQETAFSRR
jgi:hypothetical protein